MSLPTPADALRAVSLFETLTDQELEDIGAIAHFDRFEACEMLFHAGDVGTSMWVVVDGQIDVFLEHQASGDVLASIGRKGILGELSLIEPMTRSASAIAREPSTLLRIDYIPFAELRDALNPAPFKLLRELSRLVCIRIRSVNARIEGVSQLTVMPDDNERRTAITDLLRLLWSPSTPHG